MSQLPAPSLITDLENRQDEALRALAELEQRIELALSDFVGTQPKSGKQEKPAVQPEEVGTELSLHHPEESAQPSAA